MYADTSAYGGVFDRKFSAASTTFFEQVRVGRFQLVVSPVVRDELEKAPEQVRRFFTDIRPLSESVLVTTEAVNLQQAYLTSGVVGPKWAADALHVALASAAQCRLIVSWNFSISFIFRKFRSTME